MIKHTQGMSFIAASSIAVIAIGVFACSPKYRNAPAAGELTSHKNSARTLDNRMRNAELLVSPWIQYQKSYEQGKPDNSNWWAEDSVEKLELGNGDPQVLWHFIECVVKTDTAASMLRVLAAGPVEDLLSRHGEEFINRIEDKARKEPFFARSLTVVWKIEGMSDAVWARLEAACDWGRNVANGLQKDR